tara:strand:+ start:43 stop:366 length:324 start_codon:yes stop_codon:yes gene_type:complete
MMQKLYKINYLVGEIPLKSPLLFVITICSATLLSAPIFAHTCELNSKTAEDIMKYNQCIANQKSDSRLNEIRSGYESEIARLISENIKLERRISRIKNALATIISTY